MLCITSFNHSYQAQSRLYFPQSSGLDIIYSILWKGVNGHLSVRPCRIMGQVLFRSRAFSRTGAPKENPPAPLYHHRNANWYDITPLHSKLASMPALYIPTSKCKFQREKKKGVPFILVRRRHPGPGPCTDRSSHSHCHCRYHFLRSLSLPGFCLPFVRSSFQFQLSSPRQK